MADDRSCSDVKKKKKTHKKKVWTYEVPTNTCLALLLVFDEWSEVGGSDLPFSLLAPSCVTYFRLRNSDG